MQHDYPEGFQGEPHVSRTPVGNVITDRLALGIARTCLNRLEHTNRTILDKTDRHLRTGSLRGRKEAIRRIVGAKGEGIVSLRTRRNFLDAAIIHCSTVRTTEKGLAEGLSINLSLVDLRDPGMRGSYHARNWPYAFDEVLGILEIHAIARMVQRSERRELGDVMDVVRQITPWVMIAHTTLEDGSWMMPLEDGMICVQKMPANATWIDTNAKSPVSLIKTFIDCGRMKDCVMDSWRHLVAAGGLQDLSAVMMGANATDDHLQTMQEMRNAGRAWDLRRAYARQAEGRMADMPGRGHDHPREEDRMDSPSFPA